MKFLKFLHHLLDRIFIVIGAFLGSQVLLYIQQYMQRLGGHVDELKRLIAAMQANAAISGKTLEEYIQKFLKSMDPDFMRQGELMKHSWDRWNELSRAYTQINESSFWAKPYVFFSHLNSEIANATFFHFQPGLSLTLEAAYYIAIGSLLGYGFYHTFVLIGHFLHQGLRSCSKSF